MRKLLTFLVAITLAGSLSADQTNPATNTDIEGLYARIDPPQATRTGDKVEVLEMFFYGCPHCFKFQPVIEDWKNLLPDYVELRRMPAVFRESWVPLAKAYYVAEVLGILDQTHKPLFDAIHVNNQRLNSKEALMKFFEQFGVSNETFSKTYDSFAVESMVRNSMVMQEKFGLEGVPAVVVNGKYRTSGSMAGTYGRLTEVVATLAEREHKELVAQR